LMYPANMKVYFIAGLGADRRIFHHVQLPQGFEMVHLDWIKPLPGESLHSYALRLAEGIDTNEPFALAGLSMGGMIAVEIARHHKPALTILLSSIPCSGHLPFYYRLAGKLQLHKLVPISFFKSASFLKRFFTTETNADKLLIRRLIQETDNHFIRWAIGAILGWDCSTCPSPYVHIHGKRDYILPARFTKPGHFLKGGHMMVLTQAAEVNAILEKELEKLKG
jgi:pimeloyl-ACP methyl ester carboxylesterase